MTKTPFVSQELIDWLDQLYPDRCPSPDASDREVWMAVGAARVIRKLKDTNRNQTERQLGG